MRYCFFNIDRIIFLFNAQTEGRSGMIVPSGNAEAWAEAVNAMLPSDLAGRGRTSVAVMCEYTIEKMAQRHIEVLCAECGK